jgi:hypothetical protein
MTVNAVVSLALMMAVIAAYVVAARRVRRLWHPLAIVTAVTAVGIIVSVAGERWFRGGAADVPAMLRRSAIGSFGWGVVIALAVWAGRRLLGQRTRPL